MFNRFLTSIFALYIKPLKFKLYIALNLIKKFQLKINYFSLKFLNQIIKTLIFPFCQRLFQAYPYFL